MKTGKLPEHTLKRSVLNPIRFREDITSVKPGIGHDGAVVGDMVTAVSTTAFCYIGNEIYALDNAMNNVIATGGKPYAIGIVILMPERSEEADLRRISDSLAKKAAEYEVEIITGHTELVPSVTYPTITVTAYGKRIYNHKYEQVGENFDIVMTKWVGLYGGSLLATIKEEDLVTRYPSSYIKVAADYMRYTSLIPECKAIEAAVADNPDCIYAAHDVSNGGVFGALWQLLSACNCGGEIELSAMYMKQEIIEVCEYFDINPYMMNGQGSLLLISPCGEKLVDAFHEAGIEANVIGKTTKKLDRKIMIGEEERFLVPPKGDALNVVFYGQKMQI